VTSAFDLTGRLAIVTGARRGIGFAMAEALAQAGADIIGVSATLEASGSAIEQAVTSHGRRFGPSPATSPTSTRLQRSVSDSRYGPSTSSSTTRAPSSEHRRPNTRSSCGIA